MKMHIMADAVKKGVQRILKYNDVTAYKRKLLSLEKWAADTSYYLDEAFIEYWSHTYEILNAIKTRTLPIRDEKIREDLKQAKRDLDKYCADVRGGLDPNDPEVSKRFDEIWDRKKKLEEGLPPAEPVFNAAENIYDALKNGNRPDYWDVEDVYDYVTWDQTKLKTMINNRNMSVGYYACLVLEAFVGMESCGITHDTISIINFQWNEDCEELYKKDPYRVLTITYLFAMRHEAEQCLPSYRKYDILKKIEKEYNITIEQQLDLFIEWFLLYEPAYFEIDDQETRMLSMITVTGDERKFSCFDQLGLMRGENYKLVEPEPIWNYLVNYEDPILCDRRFSVVIDYAYDQEHATVDEILVSDKENVAAKKRLPDLESYTGNNFPNRLKTTAIMNRRKNARKVLYTQGKMQFYTGSEEGRKEMLNYLTGKYDVRDKVQDYVLRTGKNSEKQ